MLLFASGSWAADTGQPRELLALNADGSKVERLTSCAQASTPCDFVQVAPSPDRNRLLAIRTTPGAEAGANALYFMDLSRGVETLVFANRRIDSVDYSPDGSFILYSAIVAQTSEEDLYYSDPNGQNEQDLTSSLDFRERSPRVDPFSSTAVYEGIDASGVGRIYLFSQNRAHERAGRGGAPARHAVRRRGRRRPRVLAGRGVRRVPASHRRRQRGPRHVGHPDAEGERNLHPAGGGHGAALPGGAGLGVEGPPLRRDRRGGRPVPARPSRRRRHGPHRPPHRGRGLPDGLAPLARRKLG